MTLGTRAWLWGASIMGYALFVAWYSNLSGPLGTDEVAHYLSIAEQQGVEPERMARLRRFMETDTGSQFLMINALDLADNPVIPEGAEAGESAEQLMDRYMAHMYPALLKRACHPVFVGQAVADALELEGIAEAAHWDLGVLVRYRSRRDLLEIAFDPNFQGPHKYKLAALDKTFAFPVEPVLYTADPRFLLLVVLVILMVADLVNGARVRSDYP